MIMMMMMKKVNDDLIKIYCDQFVHSKLSNFKINHALFIVRGFRETGTDWHNTLDTETKLLFQ